MSWSTSLIICAVCIALWICLAVIEYMINKKRCKKEEKKKSVNENIGDGYYGDRSYNHDRYGGY